jgi:hypothetical protein
LCDSRWPDLHRHQAKDISLALEQSAKLSLTKAHSLGQHGLKSLFQIAGRTRNNLQHLRGGRLLLERFSEIGRALAQLVEQAGILDRDQSLGGEVFHQLDLLSAERSRLLPENHDRADQITVLQQRDVHERFRAAELRKRGRRCRIGQYVRNVNDLFRPHQTLQIVSRRRSYDRLSPPLLHESRRRPVGGDDPERIAFTHRRDSNLAPQIRTAFASMVSNTGSSSPGEPEMTCSTPEVAACCSSASASFFFRSVLSARRRSTRVLAFVLVERSLRPRVGLFAPLRTKITSSEQSLVL